MWTVIDIHGRSAAVCVSELGWTIAVLRKPGTSKPNVWFHIQAPEGVKLDHHRPPFVFSDGDIILDAGGILGMEMLAPILNSERGDYYEAFDDHVKMHIWHGNPKEGVADFIKQLLQRESIKIEVFTQPHGKEVFEVTLEGAANTIRTALQF